MGTCARVMYVQMPCGGLHTCVQRGWANLEGALPFGEQSGWGE